MWFDARAKLAEFGGHPPATSATTATQAAPVSQLSRVSQALMAENRPFVAKAASVAAPPAQTVLTGDPHEKANTILADLRTCQTDAEIEATLARYRDAITALGESVPVRAMHIENLVAFKRCDPAWPRISKAWKGEQR